jgi:tellurite resistance protein
VDVLGDVDSWRVYEVKVGEGSEDAREDLLAAVAIAGSGGEKKKVEGWWIGRAWRR